MAWFVFQFSSFVLLNGFLALSAAIITVYLQEERLTSWLKTLLIWASLAYSLIVLSQLLLGMFGLLYYPILFVLHTVFFGWLWYKKGRSYTKDWKAILPKTSVQEIDWLMLSAVFAPLLIVGFTRFFNASFQVPVEYDNLAYHLPFVVEWLNFHHLWEVYYTAYATPIGYYPSNYGLVHLWTMLPFGRDSLINMVNLPVFLLFPFAMFGLGKNLKIGTKPMLVLIALFFMLPVTLRQLGTPLVDLFFTFTFVLSLYFATEYAHSKRWQDLLVCGLVLGLFMGTKYLGLVYTIPVALLVGLVGIARHFGLKDTIKQHALLFAGAVSSTGLFWYLRNFISSGNPIFPTEVSVFGVKLFAGYEGITENLIETSLAANIPTERSVNYFIDGIFSMIGAPLFLLFVGLAGLLAWLGLKGVMMLKNRKLPNIDEKLTLSFYFALIALTALYGFSYWISPFSFKDLIPNVRYAFMFIILGIFALGIMVSRFKRLQPLFFVAGMIAVLYNFVYLVLFPALSILTNERIVLDFMQIQDYSYLALLFAFMLYGLVLLVYAVRWFAEHKAMMLIWITMFVSTAFISTLYFSEAVNIREQQRASLYEFWYSKNKEWISLLRAAEWFNMNDNDAHIAYTGLNMHYPLYGRDLQREVDYVNINDCRDCRYVDFKNSPTSILRDPDYDQWRANLSEKNKEYVVIEDIAYNSIEHRWIRQHPASFQRMFKETFTFKDGTPVQVSIYRILD